MHFDAILMHFQNSVSTVSELLTSSIRNGWQTDKLEQLNFGWWSFQESWVSVTRSLT